MADNVPQNVPPPPPPPPVIANDLKNHLDDVLALATLYRRNNEYVQRNLLGPKTFDRIIGYDDVGDRVKDYLEQNGLRTTARSASLMTGHRFRELLTIAKGVAPRAFVLYHLETSSGDLNAELLNQLRILREDACPIIFIAATTDIAALDPLLRPLFNDVVLEEAAGH